MDLFHQGAGFYMQGPRVHLRDRVRPRLRANRQRIDQF
jgi:hypothetical protein